MVRVLPFTVAILGLTSEVASVPVGTILTKIQQRLDKEADEGKNVYDKGGCWCQRNLQETGQTIDSMRSSLDSLGHDIEAQTAENSGLDIDLGQHRQELEQNQQSLDTAQALREKESASFQDEEQSHIQALSSLDGAMTALKPDHSALLSMQSIFNNSESAAILQSYTRTKGLFLQLQQAVSQRQSPDVVYGVLGRMKTNFKDELEDLRHSESSRTEDHKVLTSAKSQEINALKRQAMGKQQRYAAGKLQVEQKKEQVTRSQGLVDANVALQSSMKEFCDANDNAFQIRKTERQAEALALADAVAGLAGTQFLAVARQHMPDVENPNNPANELCMAAMEIAEKDWREKAKAACEVGKSGSMQEAADKVEALEDLIREAQQKTKDDGNECKSQSEDAQADLREATDQTEAQEGVVRSDFEQTSETLESVMAQASGAQKAKDELNSVSGALHQMMQNIRAESVHETGLMESAAKNAGAAQPHINEAIQHANKLADASIDFDDKQNALVQTLSQNFDSVQRSAGKLAIPLQMMKAEGEEDTIKVKEQKEENTHVHQASCDLSTIQAREQKLAGYLASLGKAAESLAWGSLR